MARARLVYLRRFSGDTVITTPQIQTNPSYFQLNSSGSEGYTINAQGSLDYFGTASPNSLITSNIGQSTLPANSNPITISAFTPASGVSTLFIPEVATSSVAALNANSATLYDSVAIGPNPIYVVGADSAPRVYAISQGTTPGVSTGTIAALETATQSSLSVSATLPVGINPVYGVMTSDDRRAYILNQGSATLGSGTITVINVVTNAPDVTTPSITIPNITYTNAGGATVTVAPRPIWAGLSPLTQELIILNQGDGIGPGSLSIISVPLCSSLATVTTPTATLQTQSTQTALAPLSPQSPWA